MSNPTGLQTKIPTALSLLNLTEACGIFVHKQVLEWQSKVRERSPLPSCTIATRSSPKGRHGVLLWVPEEIVTKLRQTRPITARKDPIFAFKTVNNANLGRK